MQSPPTLPTSEATAIYGNPPKLLFKAALTGFCLGTLPAVASLYALSLNGRTHHWPFAVLILLGVPTLLVLAALPFVMFHIRLEQGRIQKIFLGERVIKEYRVEDFLDLNCYEIGLLAVMRFRCGGKILIVGVGWSELNRMLRDIRKAHGKVHGRPKKTRATVHAQPK